MYRSFFLECKVINYWKKKKREEKKELIQTNWRGNQNWSRMRRRADLTEWKGLHKPICHVKPSQITASICPS